jgi:hypothetical protein
MFNQIEIEHIILNNKGVIQHFLWYKAVVFYHFYHQFLQQLSFFVTRLFFIHVCGISFSCTQINPWIKIYIIYKQKEQNTIVA